jgi:hypothetical protein
MKVFSFFLVGKTKQNKTKQNKKKNKKIKKKMTRQIKWSNEQKKKFATNLFDRSPSF